MALKTRTSKELDGPICMLTIPFEQLANAKVFADFMGLKSRFYGAYNGAVMFLVKCETAEWPHGFPAYLQGTGLKLEDLTAEFAGEMKFLTDNPAHWKEGL